MKHLLSLVFIFGVVSNTYAQMDCESIPSCAELGYTQTSCAGGKGIKCPFDETQLYCAGVKSLPDGETPTITDEDWTAACANKIDYCTAYNADCQCTACEEKYLLADNICTPECVQADHICLVWDYDICKCTKCPDGYEPNEYGICVARTVCDTTKVEHCAAYDSDYEPCECSACETDYLLDEGVCKKMCTIVANCKTYDSEYDPCNCTACEDGFTLCYRQCYKNMTCADKCQLYAGQANTKAAIEQLGNKALAAYAANQFYVGDKDGDFGQGKWYLPSVGEWMEFCGTDTSRVLQGYGSNNGNIVQINTALNTLAGKGVEAEGMKYYGGQFTFYYWTSSEYNLALAWDIYGNAYPEGHLKVSEPKSLRCSLLLKNIFTPASGGTAPQIGDVMYEDKTWGSAAEYDGSKKVVGVIAAVSEDKQDVKIINLKNLTFSSTTTVGNFDPDNPYAGAKGSTSWSTISIDIAGIQNFNICEVSMAVKVSDNCSCCSLSSDACAAEGKVFDEASCSCKPCDAGYIFENGSCVVDPCIEKCTTAYPLYAGEKNTSAIVSGSMSKMNPAGFAANQFYVGDKTGDFGQGNWYLPSIGEWMYLYGTDVNQISNGSGESGYIGTNKTLVNKALQTLADESVNAEPLTSSASYWSSSESSTGNAWCFAEARVRLNMAQTQTKNVRCSIIVKNVFDGNGTAPQIGDVMYSDKTYGSAANYNAKKTPVGVIYAVSMDNRNVSVINLKDLTTTSGVGFLPDEPYGGMTKTFAWALSSSSNISGIPDIGTSDLPTYAKASDNCPCQLYPSD